MPLFLPPGAGGGLTDLGLSASSSTCILDTAISGTLTLTGDFGSTNVACQNNVGTGVVVDFDGLTNPGLNVSNFAGTFAVTGAFTGAGILLGNASIGTSLSLPAGVRSLGLSGTSTPTTLNFASAPTFIILSGLNSGVVTTINITGNLPANSSINYDGAGQPLSTDIMDWLTSQTANIGGGSANLGTTGYDASQIISATVSGAGGADYNAGDFLAVAGGTGGVLAVVSVDGSGAITDLSVQTPGTGYATGSHATSGGSGSGGDASIVVGNPQILTFSDLTGCTVTYNHA